MRSRYARVIPFSASSPRRRRRRFTPRRRRHLFTPRRRRRRPFPFAAPILILAGGLAAWLALSPAAPPQWTGFWTGLAAFVRTGDWPAPPGVPASVDLVASGAAHSVVALPDDALAGRVSVVDGDTLDLRGVRIRLHALDAPESAQPCFVASDTVRCGQRAAMALDGWIANRPVVCIRRDVDRYGRIVAQCAVDGADMGAWLVRNGHAVAYRRYGTDYVCDEKAAARDRRGIWAMRFIEPATWRRMSHEEQRAAPARGYDPGWPLRC
jgi:endonuclease YncB( thermonuclease family)